MIDAITKHLTMRAKELANVIGLEAALILIDKFGGTAIWIPKNAKPDHSHSLLIGFEAFQKLTRYYGDTSLEIDLCAALNRYARNQKIIEDSKALTHREIAQKYSTTERNIRKILSKAGKQ